MGSARNLGLKPTIRINDPRVRNILNGFPKMFGNIINEGIANIGENTFQRNNPTFIKWPVTFFFQHTQYTPDFLDYKTSIFYEVCGNASRYYQGQNKMLRARKWFGVKIILCRPDGKILMPRVFSGGHSYLISKMNRWGRHSMGDYLQEEYGLNTYNVKQYRAGAVSPAERGIKMWMGFIVGLFVGCFLGLFLAGLLGAAARDSEVS
jgi:hypothetical protein